MTKTKKIALHELIDEFISIQIDLKHLKEVGKEVNISGGTLIFKNTRIWVNKKGHTAVEFNGIGNIVFFDKALWERVEIHFNLNEEEVRNEFNEWVIKHLGIHAGYVRTYSNYSDR